MMTARSLIAALFLALALPVGAQTPARPPNLQPVPEPPPPPPGFELDPALEPQVTIIQRGSDKVEEFRISGRLYMMKVTPPHGVSYYLIDRQGDGKFVREDTSSGISPPMWVIFTF